jgi:hypothetical protein
VNEPAWAWALVAFGMVLVVVWLAFLGAAFFGLWPPPDWATR